MKNVGLDLEGFGVDETSPVLPTTTAVATSQEVPIQPEVASQSTLMPQVVSTTSDPVVHANSSSNQLLAQIQQPLPLQATNGGQLQLVQGPDGQFVLQSAAATTPTLIAQTVRHNFECIWQVVLLGK